MAALSLKNILKYIKIVLVHPITEIVLDIIYLGCIISIGILIFKESDIYDDHKILNMAESYLDYNTFINIKTADQFKLYLSFLLNKLYTINTHNDAIPLFIPLGPIRFISFKNENECNSLNYTQSCNNFKCVIDYLSKSFNSRCGEIYDDNKNLFQKKLTGYYSSYNIRDAKNYIDITKNSYANFQTEIENSIDDKQLKALTMQINLVAPSNHNYLDVILGIEMTNYFTDVKRIFSVNILNENRPSTNLMLFIQIILLCIAIIVNIIKLLYEINIKCIWSVHIFYFFSQVFDALFMVICLIYIIEDKSLEFKVNLERFESHLAYINILWYIKSFYAILIICFPFRFLGLLSWWKSITEPFILTLNVIFRMSPGVIIASIIFLCMAVMFVFTNYFVFNDIFPYYESMFKSFVSVFDFNLLVTLYDKKKPSRIFGNLFQSQYSITIIIFQVIFFYFYSAIVIASLVYFYKKAVLLQDPPKENKYILKLDEIEKKLEEDNASENLNEDSLKKQILWLNLDDNKSLNNEISAKYQVLFFKNTNQILSFLKYIFAIKPEMQFKKLIYKLNIVIEINKKKIGDLDIKQINHLADWFIFVGCKIPIIIYGKSYFEHSLKMKLHNIYKLMFFINDEIVLDNILKNKGKKILSISDNNNFTFNSE